MSSFVRDRDSRVLQNPTVSFSCFSRALRPGRCKRLGRCALAWFMAWLIAFQPTLALTAEIVADAGAAAANRPGVDTAGNGVPLVDIVTPNGAGLSHNKYSRFEVDTRGAILNNTTRELSQSSLGGLVRGNANLRDSGSALVILNEVTSTRRSVLEGALEVHGSAADVIVANPNGIGCDGCGFINTPKVTLSTGTPELGSDGALAALRVEGGDIRIGANGADMSATEVFDLVARRIAVQGPVKAGGRLNLLAGRNTYTYATGSTTPLASDGNEPEIAIDSSLLGGMYAGRITLVSSDLGAGVRMQGHMAASAEEMTLTADGKLAFNSAQAAGRIHARSAADALVAEGTVYSNASVTLESHSSLDLEAGALVAAAGDVSLTANTVNLGDDVLAASGTDSEGNQTATGVLSVQATTLDAGSGQLAAGGKLEVTAATIDLSRDEVVDTTTLQSLDEITLVTGRIVGTNARVAAQGSLTVRSENALSLEGGDYSAAGVTLTAEKNLTTSAHLTSTSDINLTSDGALTNAAGGEIVSAGGVVLTADSFTNAGRATAQGGALTATVSKGVTNRGAGALGASGTLAIGLGGALSNAGSIVSQGAMTLAGLDGGRMASLTALADSTINGAAGLTVRAADLANAGSFASANGKLDVELSGFLSNTGFLYGGTAAHFKLDGAFTNTGGDVFAGTDLTVEGLSGARAGALANSAGGRLVANGKLEATVAAFGNAGQTRAQGGALTVDATGAVTNSSALVSSETVTIDTDGALTNAAGGVDRRGILTPYRG